MIMTVNDKNDRLRENGQEQDEPGFYVGVDTHTDTHTIAVLDATGRTLLTATYPATSVGYRTVVKDLSEFGSPSEVRVGVEGTNSYGAGLTRVLAAAGFTVFEVLRPTRQVRRMDGKSDPIDAIEAARTLISGRGISVPKSSVGPAEALRYLNAARDKYVSIMTALSSSVLSLLITAPAAIREKYSNENTAKILRALAACRPGVLDQTSVDFHVLTALKSMAQTHQETKEAADFLEARMRVLLEEHYPALLDVHGVGTITATALAITAGDNPARIRSEAAFAKLCGACPIPASSGKTNRHRLNRGGDRRGNKALHRIALTRMSKHEPTRQYVQRQTERGKTKKEILRQLKRALCREIYRTLTRPASAQRIAPGTELRTQREAKGISQTQAAKALNTWSARISDIENDRRPLPDLRTQYQHWLQAA